MLGLPPAAHHIGTSSCFQPEPTADQLPKLRPKTERTPWCCFSGLLPYQKAIRLFNRRLPIGGCRSVAKAEAKGGARALVLAAQVLLPAARPQRPELCCLGAVLVVRCKPGAACLNSQIALLSISSVRSQSFAASVRSLSCAANPVPPAKHGSMQSRANRMHEGHKQDCSLHLKLHRLKE